MIRKKVFGGKKQILFPEFAKLVENQSNCLVLSHMIRNENIFFVMP